jgi:hypothetical protein
VACSAESPKTTSLKERRPEAASMRKPGGKPRTKKPKATKLSVEAAGWFQLKNIINKLKIGLKKKDKEIFLRFEGCDIFYDGFFLMKIKNCEKFK